MNHNTANSDHVGSMSNSLSGISKKGVSDATVLPSTMHGEAAQHYDRNRIRHISPELARGARHRDGTGSEGIIANYFRRFTCHIGPGRARDLIGTRPSLQPVVERDFSRREIRGLEGDSLILEQDGLAYSDKAVALAN